MEHRLAGQFNLQRLFDPGNMSDFVLAVPMRGTSVAKASDAICTLIGCPQFNDEDAAAVANASGLADGLMMAWRRHGIDVTSHIRGGYAFAIADASKGQAFLAVDRFAIETLCYYADDHSIAFSDQADCVEGRGSELDPQALFDYLFFHMIPAPRTIFRKVRRLPAGHSLLVDRQGLHLQRHWPLRFDEKHRQPFPDARNALRTLISNAVARETEGHDRVGAFLSGGTDSSTVAGMLCQVIGGAAPTYSIGFEADGYDEMAYARLAAKHFGCDHHEYYVTPADLLSSISAVGQHFDQPFGNSSALPAYYCAKMSLADGCTKMLAGDGGDELFGGNTRYATQRFLNTYHLLPLRARRFIEPMCGDDSVLRRIPGLRQATGYVRHSRLPMPHRLQSMNLAMQLDPAAMLTADFLARIDVAEPARHMQDTWDACEANSLVNQMLAYDWRYTLADSDLRKVHGATSMAGIAVGYPLLSDELVDFSMMLPPAWKLRGFKLRWFFKEAMRGFLPDEIIAKKKQGFGLPYGPWTARNPALRKLAHDSLQGLVDRRIVREPFVAQLIDRQLDEHPGYYGEMIWILMMLEQWLRGHPDAHLPS